MTQEEFAAKIRALSTRIVLGLEGEDRIDVICALSALLVAELVSQSKAAPSTLNDQARLLLTELIFGHVAARCAVTSSEPLE